MSPHWVCIALKGIIMTATDSRVRLHGLDAVRGFALILGVALHASMSFLPGIQIWVVADSSRSPLMSVLFYVLHMFRMLLFFLIAGFFARMSFHRLGLKGFVIDRVKRILVPLVVAWLPVFVAIIAILTWNATIANGGTPPPPASTPGLSPSNFPLVHLWFLYVLLLLYAAILVARVVLNYLGMAKVADGFVRLVLGWGGTVLIALPMTVVLYFQTNWLAWFGVPTPDMSLYPNLTALISYGTAFGFGWLLNRQPELLKKFEQRWAFHLVLALIGTTSSLVILGLTPVLIPTTQDISKFLYALLYGFTAWSWVFALLGLAIRFLNNENPVRRYLADASYWIYLVHLPLVMALQTLVARLELSWLLKFPLVLMVTLMIAISSYHVLVRFSFIGVILNGKRAAKAKPSSFKPYTST